MTDLGPLKISLSVEGLSEMLNALKSVKAAIEDIDKQDNKSSKNRLKNNADQVKAIREQGKVALEEEKNKTKLVVEEEKRRTAVEKEESNRRLTQLKEDTANFDAEEKKKTRLAKTQVDERTKNETAALKKQAAAYQKYVGGPIEGGIKRGFSTAGRMLGYAVSAAAGSQVYGAFEQEKEFKLTTSQVDRSALFAGHELDIKALREQERQTANELGVSPVDIAKGDLALAKGGGADLINTRVGKDVARIGLATDTDSSEIAEILNTIHKQNPNANQDQLHSFLMHAVAQKGLFGEDVAKNMANITNSAGKFAGVAGNPAIKATVENQLMALTGIAKTGGGNNSTVTGFLDKVLTLADTPKTLAKYGLKRGDFVDKTGHLLGGGPNELIDTILTKTKGDPSQLIKEFGKGSEKLFEGLSEAYHHGGIPEVNKTLLERERATTNDTMIDEGIKKYKQDNPLQVAMQESTNNLATAINQYEPQMIKALDSLSGIMSNLPVMLATTILAPSVGVAIGTTIGGVAGPLIGSAIRLALSGLGFPTGLPGAAAPVAGGATAGEVVAGGAGAGSIAGGAAVVGGAVVVGSIMYGLSKQPGGGYHPENASTVPGVHYYQKPDGTITTEKPTFAQDIAPAVEQVKQALHYLAGLINSTHPSGGVSGPLGPNLPGSGSW